MDKVRVRIAPSPTAALGIGSARAALFNWLYARATGGRVVLRSEDLDQERVLPQAEDAILEDLNWLGINWDEGPDKGGQYGPYRQSERMDIYERFVKRLVEDKLAYPCFCNEEELADQRREMLSHGETPRYTGRCRSLTEEDRERLLSDGREPVIRFRVPGGKPVEFTDIIQGELSYGSESLSDFIIAKADGSPTYNMAVVLDDHLMGISHVIRGDERLANTARQILLYEALGWHAPKFAHLPGLADEQGRLSMAIGGQTISDLKERGYLAATLVNYLFLLGCQAKEDDIISLDEAVENFGLENISSQQVVFSPTRLKGINSHYLKKSSPETILDLALPHLRSSGYIDEPSADQRKWLLKVAETMRGELGEVAEITEKAAFFFEDQPQPVNAKARQVLGEEQVPQVLSELKGRLDELDEFKPARIRTLLRQLCKDLELTTRRVYLPIRVALTGALQGPGIFSIIALLGPEKVRARIEAALRTNNQRG